MRRFVSLLVMSGIFCLGLGVPFRARAGSLQQTTPRAAQQLTAQAYTQSGGKGGLGLPSGGTISWGEDCLQDYRGGRAGRAAIVITDCQELSKQNQKDRIQPSALVMRGEFWEYADKHGAAVIGRPIGDDQVTDGGRWQTFRGGSWEIADLYQARESDTPYAVRGEIRTNYLVHGGVSGDYGWPISEQYEWQGELRQDFQLTSLAWRAETGVREIGHWNEGQVLSSPTSNPTHYIIRELGSYRIGRQEQLERCWRDNPKRGISSEELKLTLKNYPEKGEAPECTTPQEQSAITWAKQQLKRKNSAWSPELGGWWSGKCEAFVEIAYGTRGRAYSASQHYQWRKGRGQIHTDTAAPAGALVFYGGSSDGHIGISIGNGLVISTQGYPGDQLPVWQHRVTGLSNPYLGWSYADGQWPR